MTSLNECLFPRARPSFLCPWLFVILRAVLLQSSHECHEHEAFLPLAPLIALLCMMLHCLFLPLESLHSLCFRRSAHEPTSLCPLDHMPSGCRRGRSWVRDIHHLHNADVSCSFSFSKCSGSSNTLQTQTNQLVKSLFTSLGLLQAQPHNNHSTLLRRTHQHSRCNRCRHSLSQDVKFSPRTSQHSCGSQMRKRQQRGIDVGLGAGVQETVVERAASGERDVDPVVQAAGLRDGD